MKKSIAASIAALLIAGGIALAAPASATQTPPTECVPADAWTEVINHPAVGEPTIPNPAYVPEVIYVPAVTHTEYKFVHKSDIFALNPKWSADPEWNAETNPESVGWVKTEDTRQVIDVPEVPGSPAVGQPTIDNPEYVPAYDETIEHPAVVCEEDPEPVVNTCPAYVDGPTSTNLAPLWSNVDTRSAGHYEYVDNGLHVWTDDASSNAKVSLGYPASFPLANTGVLDLDWTGSTPPPGINLFVNFGADGNGTLVYESVYGQDLWLTNGSSAAVKANAPVNGGGNGSQWHGTIDQWLAEYPEATVVGIAFSLGSGVHGDGVINSLTAGCTTYTFDYLAPLPEDTTVPGEWSTPVITCDSEVGDEVTITREVLITTYTRGENGEPVAHEETVTENDVYIVTEEDIAALECPVTEPTPTPTTEPTPTSTPAPAAPAKASTDSLAQTGTESNWLGLTVGAMAVALAGLAAVFGARARQVRQK